MRLSSSLCYVLFALILTACNPQKFNQTESNVADVDARIKNNRNHFIDQGKKPIVQVKEDFYVDDTPIDLIKSPQWLANRIVLRGEQLPFSYYSRAVAQGAGDSVLTTFQSDLDPAVQLSINYSGNVRGALDALASKTGYIYSVQGRKIHWEAFVTKTFDVGFMPGSSDYLMGKTSTGNDGGAAAAGGGAATGKDYVSTDPSSSEYSNLSGKLSIWKDLESTLSKMLSDKGKVVVSEASTSVTVTDRPYYVDMVSTYIQSLNQTLAKQVLVKVQILEVQLGDDYIYGINWNLIANQLLHNQKFILNANYGTPISITAFGASSSSGGGVPTIGFDKQSDSIPSYQALVRALSQQGKTSIVSEPRVLCLNNQVSAIRIVNEENYIASIQNTSQSAGNAIGTTTSQITPGKLTTGLTLYILPKILNDNVFLQVNADISTNQGIADVSVGTDANKTTLGLPKVSMKHFNQRSMIKSGDTLILSGFKQISNQANQMQFLRSRMLGGEGSQQKKSETIILITPIILNGSA